MSIRNQGAAVKAVRRRNSFLNRRGWISALIPSGVSSFFSRSAAVTWTGWPTSASVTSAASSSRPFWASQRGLSGTPRRRMTMISAGIAPKPSIQRQESRSGAISSTITPTTAPSRIPTACRLKALTSQRPRPRVGSTSAR